MKNQPKKGTRGHRLDSLDAAASLEERIAPVVVARPVAPKGIVAKTSSLPTGRR